MSGKTLAMILILLSHFVPADSLKKRERLPMIRTPTLARILECIKVSFSEQILEF
jgi:hypothetical protein